jgi:hypothetical protein
VRSEADQSFDFPLEPARSKPVDGSKKPPPKKDPEIGASTELLPGLTRPSPSGLRVKSLS